MMPPLSLYVHIPWCVRKCPYCDFNSHETQRIPEAEYVKVLNRDLQIDAALANGRKLQSIFFGGGTPSLFSGQAIGRIIHNAEQTVGFASAIEITLEVNPGTAEFHALQDYRAAGVNRISFGVQSFHDRSLQKLGRIHSAQEVYRAIELARKAGFNNLNLDLMHGLPEQTLAEAMTDLERAVAIAPEHLSWYQLTIEPNTVFYRQPPSLPHDDTLEEIQIRGASYLATHGYLQYEVSAYARDGKQCLHNLNYWQFGDYLAVGAGAHGKITQADGSIQRYQKTRTPKDYLSAESTTSKRSELSPADAALEFMMNALRLNDGVPVALFEERTGLSFNRYQTAARTLIERGLLDPSPERISPTPLGHAFLNNVLTEFADIIHREQS